MTDNDRSKVGRSTAYTDSRQQKYYQIEEMSWWYKYRERVFEFLIGEYFKKEDVIFDIGGGNGFNTKALQNIGYEVVLIEPTLGACENAKERGCLNVLNLSLQEYNGSIEQFVCTDVIEHIKDDESFVNHLFGRMPKGGKGLITVPACMGLWSSEDEMDGHFRRYSKSNLERLVDQDGIRLLYCNYFFEFLWFPIYLRRHLLEKLSLVHKVTERSEEEERAVTKKQFLEPDGIVGKVLEFFERKELNKVYNGKKILYGSSLVCVVKKD